MKDSTSMVILSIYQRIVHLQPDIGISFTYEAPLHFGSLAKKKSCFGEAKYYLEARRELWVGRRPFVLFL